MRKKKLWTSISVGRLSCDLFRVGSRATEESQNRVP